MKAEIGTEQGTEAMVRTIPAREIKRRGIGAVDELLKERPVHVIKHDRPSYVIPYEGHYEELVEGYREAYVARVKESLEDVAAGRVRRFASADALMAAIDAAGEDAEDGRDKA